MAKSGNQQGAIMADNVALGAGRNPTPSGLCLRHRAEAVLRHIRDVACARQWNADPRAQIQQALARALFAPNCNSLNLSRKRNELERLHSTILHLHSNFCIKLYGRREECVYLYG
jgi:hypothetical protein